MKVVRLLAAIALVSTSLCAIAGSGVSINGVDLSPSELVALERQLGTYIVPGDYISNPQTGYWKNLTTGDSGYLNLNSGGGSPADRWVSPEELTHGGLRGVRPGVLSTYDFVR
ncbi:MAG: hypothetical protein U9R74_13010 [Pseudomonadota bacterium]|nr:hypothetical protein [Pseudomonadota bacterium]